MDENEMAALKAAKKQLRALIHKRLIEVPEASIAEQSRRITAKVLSLPRYMTAKRIGVYLSMPKGEVTTSAIVLDAVAQGKQVFVPYIYEAPPKSAGERSRKVMDMVSIHSEEDYKSIENHRDAWGIPSVESKSVTQRNTVVSDEVITVPQAEKSESTTKTPIKQKGLSKCDLEMIVMPGMAFDHRCGRLGHGKGFYDTFLQRYHDSRILDAEDGHALHSLEEMPFLVGLALNEQIMSNDQEVPMSPSDWRLDALINGQGSVLERPNKDSKGSIAERPRPHSDSTLQNESK